MMSAIFIAGGISQLREPGAQAKPVEPVTDLIARSIPKVPRDAETLIRVNGAVQVGAGILFALGRFPRLSPLLLAMTLPATTAGAHRFWEEADPTQRANHQAHFLKNAGLFGGLLFAAVAGRSKRSAVARASASGIGKKKRR